MCQHCSCGIRSFFSFIPLYNSYSCVWWWSLSNKKINQSYLSTEQTGRQATRYHSRRVLGKNLVCHRLGWFRLFVALVPPDKCRNTLISKRPLFDFSVKGLEPRRRQRGRRQHEWGGICYYGRYCSENQYQSARRRRNERPSFLGVPTPHWTPDLPALQSVSDSKQALISGVQASISWRGISFSFS